MNKSSNEKPYKGTKKDQFTIVLEGLRSDFRLFGDGLQSLDQKFGNLDGRVERVEHKVDSLDVKVGVLDHKVESLDVKVRALDRRVEVLDTKVDGLDAKFSGLEIKFDGLDPKFEILDRKCDVLSSDMYIVKNIISMIDKKTDRIEFDLKKNLQNHNQQKSEKLIEPCVATTKLHQK